MIAFNGRVHFGLAFIIWILLVLTPDTPVPLNPFGFLLGAIFPDADIKYSKIGRILPLWLFFKHRGFTHTWWGLVLFSGIMCIAVSVSCGIAFSLGYLLHLGLDSSTPMGVNWWGKRKRRIA